jgi:hypothetical protein
MTCIGNDFVRQLAPRGMPCSECGARISKGAECLVAIRKGKVQKRVCGEECRLQFDANYWDNLAQSRGGR